jgi:hypothetical protein
MCIVIGCSVVTAGLDHPVKSKGSGIVLVDLRMTEKCSAIKSSEEIDNYGVILDLSDGVFHLQTSGQKFRG